MSTLSGGCNPNVSFTLATQVGTNPAGSLPEVLNLVCQFLDGTGADQAHLIHAKPYNLAASTPQAIDLRSCAGLDGSTISFSSIAFFLYRIQASNDAFSVAFGGAGAGEWNGFLTSGSKFVGQPSTAGGNHGFSIVTAPNATGMPVTSGSHLFQIDPGSNPVGNVDIIFVGR